MRFSKSGLIVAAAFAAIFCGGEAAAQRAEEDVLTSAEDAFGTTVGGETIGLYDASNARGFSPARAGNLRMEGLFFDNRAGGGNRVRMSSRLTTGVTVRVGLSAQSYPFPSPTGIADYTLRIPGDTFAVSTLFKGGYPELESVEIDSQIPISSSLSLGIGISAEHSMTDWARTNSQVDGALIGRWRVGENIEVLPFYSRTRQFGNEWGPFLFSASTVLPPKYDRSLSLSQDWTGFNNDDVIFGTIVKGNWSDWHLNAGLFRSLSWRLGGDTTQVHYRNIQPDGMAELWYVRLAPGGPPQASVSGEVRLTRTFNEGPRRHVIHINARGKSTQANYGGNVSRYISMVQFDEPTVLAPPDFDPGSRGREYVRQILGGVTYNVLWKDVGEFSAGIQRTRYTRYTKFLNPTPSETTNEWLYNATLAAYLTQRLALYASYTRGLEDAPRAPPYAVNSGASAAATLTQQIDGGFRYTLMRGVNLVGGVFEVKKPFFELDPTGFFRELGNVRHRGIEVSLSGSPLPGLTVVTGLVGLQARLSGLLVDNGTLGPIPPETIPLTGIFNVQYGPESWNGFSLDARMTYNGPYTGDVQNTFKSEAVTLIDVGARYRFSLAGQPAALRFQVQNLFDVWKWQVQGTQLQVRPTNRRKVTMQLTVDY